MNIAAPGDGKSVTLPAVDVRTLNNPTPVPSTAGASASSESVSATTTTSPPEPTTTVGPLPQVVVTQPTTTAVPIPAPVLTAPTIRPCHRRPAPRRRPERFPVSPGQLVLASSSAAVGVGGHAFGAPQLRRVRGCVAAGPHRGEVLLLGRAVLTNGGCRGAGATAATVDSLHRRQPERGAGREEAHHGPARHRPSRPSPKRRRPARDGHGLRRPRRPASPAMPGPT